MKGQFIARVIMLRENARMRGLGTEANKQVWEFAEGVVCVLTRRSLSWYVHYHSLLWKLADSHNPQHIHRNDLFQADNVHTLRFGEARSMEDALRLAKESLVTVKEGLDWLTEPEESQWPNVTYSFE